MEDKKPIVHVRFSPNDYPPSELKRYYENFLNCLEGQYRLIFSPFDVQFADDESIALILDGKSYTHTELLEMLEKSRKYDGLIK